MYCGHLVSWVLHTGFVWNLLVAVFFSLCVSCFPHFLLCSICVIVFSTYEISLARVDGAALYRVEFGEMCPGCWVSLFVHRFSFKPGWDVNVVLIALEARGLLFLPSLKCPQLPEWFSLCCLRGRQFSSQHCGTLRIVLWRPQDGIHYTQRAWSSQGIVHFVQPRFFVSKESRYSSLPSKPKEDYPFPSSGRETLEGRSRGKHLFGIIPHLFLPFCCL